MQGEKSWVIGVWKSKWTSDIAPSLWDGFSSGNCHSRNHRKCLGEKIRKLIRILSLSLVETFVSNRKSQGSLFLPYWINIWMFVFFWETPDFCKRRLDKAWNWLQAFFDSIISCRFPLSMWCDPRMYFFFKFNYSWFAMLYWYMYMSCFQQYHFSRL